MNRHKIARVLAEIAETEAEEIAALPDETPITDLGLSSLDFYRKI